MTQPHKLNRMKRFECPEFRLGEKLTPEQLAFFKKHGVIKFSSVFPREAVKTYRDEIRRIDQQWISDGITKVNGIPLKFGEDGEGKKTIQRMCFLNKYSPHFEDLLRDPRLQALTELLSPYEGRISEDEKDGLILNNYGQYPNSSFTQMGWHTDCPRDLFLGQRIMPMLNVGIHLDDVPFENGGLRVIPGTHTQGMMRMLFGKKYFVDHKPDPREVGFDIQAGDLTVHDGRLWHRAQRSPHAGEASRRRVMYVPIITGKYMPKSEKSATPFYHRLASRVQN